MARSGAYQLYQRYVADGGGGGDGADSGPCAGYGEWVRENDPLAADAGDWRNEIVVQLGRINRGERPDSARLRDIAADLRAAADTFTSSDPPAAAADFNRITIRSLRLSADVATDAADGSYDPQPVRELVDPQTQGSTALESLIEACG